MMQVCIRAGKKSEREEGFPLPVSKSICNRLLVMDFLTGEELPLSDGLPEDVILLRQALRDIRQGKTTFEVGNAGTVARFLTALLSLLEGEWTINANERMNHRPFSPLITELETMGARIKPCSATALFPLRIKGGGLVSSGIRDIASGFSSQFISALCLVAPYVGNGIRLRLHPMQVSLPYIRMTLELMKENGANVSLEENIITVREGKYDANIKCVENDWSAAAFAYAAVCLNGNISVRLENLYENSIQGDMAVRDIFEKHFQLVSSFEGDCLLIRHSDRLSYESEDCHIDFRDCPDLFLPVLICSVFEKNRFVFDGLDTLQYKESDRLNAIERELEKVGIGFSRTVNGISFDRERHFRFCADKPVQFSSYNDHRIAMALSLLGFRCREIIIEDAMCVRKSFPMYWESFSRFADVKIMDYFCQIENDGL